MNDHHTLTPIERIRSAYATFAGQVILTTSGRETPAAMPHLVASALGSKDFLLVTVDQVIYSIYWCLYLPLKRIKHARATAPVEF